MYPYTLYTNTFILRAKKPFTQCITNAFLSLENNTAFNIAKYMTSQKISNDTFKKWCRFYYKLYKKYNMVQEMSTLMNRINCIFRMLRYMCNPTRLAIFTEEVLI